MSNELILIGSMPTTTKIIILAVVLLILLLIFVFFPSKTTKAKTLEYLKSLSTNIYNIIIANLEYRLNTDDEPCDVEYEVFKKNMIKEITNDTWSMLKSYIDSAITDNKLDYTAKIALNKKNVKDLINIMVNQKDIQDKFIETYNTLTNEVFKEMMKEENKAREEAEAAEKQPLEDGGDATKETVTLFDDPDPTTDQLKEVEEEYKEEEETATVDVEAENTESEEEEKNE